MLPRALIALAPFALLPGEELPPGPPWKVTYEAAKADALKHGRPVFVYFTKSY